ncbi:uncharacterized protein LOC124803121 isoform X1 [Schistocerca piceifrons]|uniref:uncharacterized protein LOC124803121 isoform X1 n=2 Tax=Schistocerca piceifrons TaxID=274613 RepID=UPI001F5F2707|nr:uncharacterized protein LOC124803121 isoform X1 [Schistocerca piceifrons]
MDSKWTDTKKSVNKNLEDLKKELEGKWKLLPPSEELKSTAHDRFLTGLKNYMQNFLKEEEELLTEHQIKVLREDVEKMWALCCYTDTQKEEFPEYNVPVVSETILDKHRKYLATLEVLYKNNELVFSSAKKYFDLWHHVQDLEKQLSDPTRLFTNRGALLLKNEKDRKDGKKELIRLEGELTRLAKQHEEKYGNQLLIHGETVISWLQKFKPESFPGSTCKSRVRPWHNGMSSQTSTAKKRPCTTDSTISNGPAPAKQCKRSLHGKVNGF